MSSISRFEELNCWKKARELANSVYDLSSAVPFTKDHALSQQIRRAAGSSMHNIAEGSHSGTNPEFIRFPKMSRRSASEFQSQLYLALDRGYITEAQLEETYELSTSVKKLINGLIGYLNRSQKP